MCVRTDSPFEIIDWADPETAAEAIEQLYDGPCSPLCEWSHVRVWTEPGRLHIVSHDRPTAPGDFSDELRAAGYRSLHHSGLATTPEHRPRPSALNEPLRPRGAQWQPTTRTTPASH